MKFRSNKVLQCSLFEYSTFVLFVYISRNRNKVLLKRRILIEGAGVRNMQNEPFLKRLTLWNGHSKLTKLISKFYCPFDPVHNMQLDKEIKICFHFYIFKNNRINTGSNRID